MGTAGAECPLCVHAPKLRLRRILSILRLRRLSDSDSVRLYLCVQCIELSVRTRTRVNPKMSVSGISETDISGTIPEVHLKVDMIPRVYPRVPARSRVYPRLRARTRVTCFIMTAR